MQFVSNAWLLNTVLMIVEVGRVYLFCPTLYLNVGFLLHLTKVNNILKYFVGFFVVTQEYLFVYGSWGGPHNCYLRPDKLKT